MRPILLTVTILSLILFVSSSPQGHIHDRSGDIVLRPEHAHQMRHSKFVIAHTPNFIQFKNQKDSTAAFSVVGNVIAKALHFPSSAEQEVNIELPQTSYFRRPSANILLVVQGAQEDITYSSSDATTFNIEHYARKPIKALSALLTGVSPSKHGIVGNSWGASGRAIRAFSSPKSGFTHATFVDMFAQSYNNSLTLAVSADATMARAANVNEQILNKLSAKLKSQHLVETLAEEPAAFDTEFFDSDVTISKDGKTATVVFNSESVTFTSADKEIVALFAELNLIHRALRFLNTHNSAEPELATFIISTLPAVRHSLTESHRLRAALSVVNKFVHTFMTRVSAHYGKNALVELALLDTEFVPSVASQVSGDHLRNLYKSLKHVVNAADFENFKEMLPNIYCRNSHIEKACETVKSFVSGLSLPFQVSCRSTPKLARRDAGVSDADADAAWPPIFNIIIWLFIGLAIALVAIVYSLMYLDPGYDSVIYRMTNTRPKAE